MLVIVCNLKIILWAYWIICCCLRFDEGHYTAIILRKNNDNFEISDEAIEKVNIEEKIRNSCLLFFEKINDERKLKM